MPSFFHTEVDLLSSSTLDHEELELDNGIENFNISSKTNTAFNENSLPRLLISAKTALTRKRGTSPSQGPIHPNSTIRNENYNNVSSIYENSADNNEKNNQDYEERLERYRRERAIEAAHELEEIMEVLGMTQNDDINFIDEELTDYISLYWSRLGWTDDGQLRSPEINNHNSITNYDPNKADIPSSLPRLDTIGITSSRIDIKSPTSSSGSSTPYSRYTFSPTFNTYSFNDGFIITSPHHSPATSPQSPRDDDFDNLEPDNIGNDIMDIFDSVELGLTTLNQQKKKKGLFKRTKSGGLVPYQSYSHRSHEGDYNSSLHFDVINLLEQQMNVPTTNRNRDSRYHSKRISWRNSLDIMKMRRQINPFLHLPKELHIYILSFLEFSDIMMVTLVSLDLCVVCEHDLLWKQPCISKGMSLDNVQKRLRRYFVENQIRVAVVGDAQVGKSVLQKRLTNNPQQIFESYSPGTQYNTLARYQAQNYYIYYTYESNNRHRYIGQRWDVVLVCFSTEAYHTLKKAKQWIKTARAHRNNVILLVGLKTDIRHDVLETNDPTELVGLVTPKEASDVALRYKCLGYVECSSKTKEGFNELIEMIIQGKSLAFNQNKKISSFGKMFKLSKLL